jgi:hypothetical protein
VFDGPLGRAGAAEAAEAARVGNRRDQGARLRVPHRCGVGSSACD